MEEIKIKQIEVFGRRFEIIKSSFRNPCNECELLYNCRDKGGTFIYNFVHKILHNLNVLNLKMLNNRRLWQY